MQFQGSDYSDLRVPAVQETIMSSCRSNCGCEGNDGEFDLLRNKEVLEESGTPFPQTVTIRFEQSDA